MRGNIFHFSIGMMRVVNLLELGGGGMGEADIQKNLA